MALAMPKRMFVAVDFDKTIANIQTDGGMAGDDYRTPEYLARLSAIPSGHPEKYELISHEALDFIRAVMNAGHDFGIASFNDGELGGEKYIRAALMASGLEPHYLAQIKIVSRRNNIDPEDGSEYEAPNKNQHLQDLLIMFARPDGYYSTMHFYDDTRKFVAEAARLGFMSTLAPAKGLSAFWASEAAKLSSVTKFDLHSVSGSSETARSSPVTLDVRSASGSSEGMPTAPFAVGVFMKGLGSPTAAGIVKSSIETRIIGGSGASKDPAF